MAAKSKDNSGDIMDVSKPGSNAPDTTGKPVIVGHKPMVKEDPMMAPKVTNITIEEEKENEDKDKASHTGVKIEPSAELKAEAEKKADEEEAKAKEDEATKKEEPVRDSIGDDEPKAEEPKTEEPKPDEAKAEPKTEVAPEETKPEAETTETTPSSDTGAVDALAKEAEAKKQEQQMSAEEQKRQEAVQQLIDSKQYVVPISKHAKSRGGAKAVFMTVIILLLVLGVGLELAIDAGLIDVGVPPIVDLIKN